MAYTYDVQANVIHASKYAPTGKEHILLDTHILLWMFYPKFSSPMLGIDPPKPNQIRIYPALLKSLISSKSMLYYTGFNLPELFHQVERFECALYCHGANDPNMKPKQFRHEVTGAMQLILDEVKTIWSQVGRIAYLDPIAMNADFLNDSLSQYGQYPVDGYDRMMLEAARRAAVPYWILSDDGDMACIPGVTVITENQHVLGEAYSKKLVLL